MNLTQSLAIKVPVRLQDRGQYLHRKGRVLHLRGDDREVDAKVVGNSGVYSVALDLVEGELAYSCTCPYFEGNQRVCKHVWAVLLAAERAGHLGAGRSRNGGPPIGARANGGPHDAITSGGRMAQLGALIDARRRFPRWEAQLQEIGADPPQSAAWPENRRVVYTVHAPATIGMGRLSIDIAQQDVLRSGSPGKPKPLRFSARLIEGLPDALDREVLSMILGAAEAHTGAYDYSAYAYMRGPTLTGSRLTVPPAVSTSVLPAICRTGRGSLETGEGEPVPLALDEGPPWELCVDVVAAPGDGGYDVGGVLRRDGSSLDLTAPAFLLEGGFVVGRDGTVARLLDSGAFRWVSAIRRGGPLSVPAGQADEFLARLLGMRNLPRVQLPPELAYEEVPAAAEPCLRITRAQVNGWNARTELQATLSFDYGGETVEAGTPGRGVFRDRPRRLLLRDRPAEADADRLLAETGLRPASGGKYTLAPRRLPAVVRALTGAGWRVEAEGSLYRTASGESMRVRSEMDWFELEGELDFGDQSASMPELLEALRRGEDYVRLGDGSIGVLPEEWLGRLATVAGLGTPAAGSLRFKRTQVSLLDALFASRPGVSFDETFLGARQRLLEYAGAEPGREPEGFGGELRPYQRDGLGWFRFLQEFGFGGCLADDMGLGKTVQVLALLDSRRRDRGPSEGKPSLVVVPRSLVFNWLEEARRFTPGLRVLDHTGTREAPGSHFGEVDVVLTTYGTLRKDAAALADIPFDYCILDEAQAIKNGSTVSARAARLIQADHRLALSGTPIENHLGELWSLFEFLNPGMLGSARAFRSGIRSRDPDDRTREALGRALRPFILRRTKEQVAKDLPPKTEQTQFCDLSPVQRKQYDQLRTHYRRDLLGRVDRDGIAKSKMFVLEALLRLRQAACHPGLLDAARGGEPSAKLDMLVPQLVEVAAEGHKAIVFSQFTKLLGILKGRLDREGLAYEYLDGRTRDRQERVARFQEDPGCRLFLISLKAGGLGLNLTAAEYVFLLDPWWNPAVEAQAIDRAHRIGQQRPVFAYRIIARDTVEEKVLQLQDSKRALADAIITADNSVLRGIRREDLELLLS